MILFILNLGKPMPLTQKILLSMLAGAGGAMVGSPADVVLVFYFFIYIFINFY